MPVGIFLEGTGEVKYLLLAIIDFALYLIYQTLSFVFCNMLQVLLPEFKEEMDEHEK
jgi:hypothetical protein